MKIARSRLKELVKQSIYELIEGGPGSGRPRAATPATDKDNKRPTKNPFSKESPAHTPWEKKHGKKSKSSASRKTAKARMKKKIKHAEPKQSKPKSWKKESVKESKGRRCTVKEVQKWMKGLEENRYKRTYISDCRRVSWMVNHLGEDVTNMPKSFRKKWTKAQYGRERQLAREFIKHLDSKQLQEQKLRKLIRSIIKENLKKKVNEGPRDFIHHSEAKFLKVWKSHANKAQKLLKKFKWQVEFDKKHKSGYITVTTTKKVYDDVLEILMNNNIKIRG